MNGLHNTRIVSVAPMMGYTDRHARYLYRLISPHALLYTEMLTAKALLHGDHQALLQFDELEHPIVLQIGGSDPHEMTYAAMLAESAGFDEININVGCPSDRVQSGTFGACLMATPDLVARIYTEINNKLGIPTTIKHRIGIDEQDSFNDLENFVTTVADKGCKTFIVHARKAWLKGLSPKQNRDVPPLEYERVYRLKQDHPELTIIINGGIKTVEEAKTHLAHTDGVMIGREVFNQPWLLADMENLIYPDAAAKITRLDVQTRYACYMQKELQNGASLHAVVKPLLGLFHGLQGAKNWRRKLTETVQKSADAKSKLPMLVAEYNNVNVS